MPPWSKGVSGNPRGMKKGTRHSLQGRLKRLLKKRPPEQWMSAVESLGLKINDPRVADIIAVRLIQLAVEGSIPSIRLIADLTEPPLTDEIAAQPTRVVVVSPNIERQTIKDAIPVEDRVDQEVSSLP